MHFTVTEFKLYHSTLPEYNPNLNKTDGMLSDWEIIEIHVTCHYNPPQRGAFTTYSGRDRGPQPSRYLHYESILTFVHTYCRSDRIIVFFNQFPLYPENFSSSLYHFTPLYSLFFSLSLSH